VYWYYVSKAIKNKLKLIQRKQAKLAVWLDIVNFQNYATPITFAHAARLMIIKWRNLKEPGIELFVEYFTKTWRSPKRVGWIDHYADWIPVTNNSMESLNGRVKSKGICSSCLALCEHRDLPFMFPGTLRARMSIQQLCHVMETGFIKKWSTDRNETVLNAINEPNVGLSGN
jgi:hypothetical protein